MVFDLTWSAIHPDNVFVVCPTTAVEPVDPLKDDTVLERTWTPSKTLLAALCVPWRVLTPGQMWETSDCTT